MKNVLSCLIAAITAGASAQPITGRIVVQVDKPSIRISSIFYGLMTEEINHGYDGGLYAELIQNRSFRDNADHPAHWALVTDGGAQGTMALETGPSLHVSAPSVATGQRVGVANDGYWGIPVKPRSEYRITLEAKADQGFSGPLDVDIESSDGSKRFASGQVRVRSSGWQKLTVTLRTANVPPTAEARFVIATHNPGAFWIRYASVFPPTFHNRPNGNRIDLMEKLGALNPRFLRLPGGNYLEGDTIDERFNWKTTLGDPTQRVGHQGPWGYRSSDGLGLLEYLEWCEDLHMQPLLAVYAGYSLRGQHVNPGADLEPFVQDALDEIEYVTGSTNTKWGSIRANNGHPRPFALKYVEIGNEDWFDRSRSYGARFAQFFDAIKAKYPRLQLIATGPVTTRKPDVVDDHYYRTAAQMERDAHHYDTADRNGPKIFVGEWASIEGSPTPNLRGALGDGAWLTGLEKDSDLVVMESYAPLLVNVNRGAAQWGTNLIGYNALSSFNSPSAYVQAMFAANTGDVALPATIELDEPPATPARAPHGAIGVGTWRTDSEFKDAQVAHNGETIYSKDFATGVNDWKLLSGTWKVEDGNLRQTTFEEGTLATTGDTDWTDYTYRVKARKLSGAEGFIVLFHVHDGENFWQWNVGGWDNTRTAIQRIEGGAAEEVGTRSRVKVDAGRWYDVRVEVHGSTIQCYLDDKLVSEATEAQSRPVDPIYVAASKVSASGEVMLKVVNVSSKPATLELDLQGAGSFAESATASGMSGMPDDVNTVAEPTKLAPKLENVRVSGHIAKLQLAPYSVHVLRFKPASGN